MNHITKLSDWYRRSFGREPDISVYDRDGLRDLGPFADILEHLSIKLEASGRGYIAVVRLPSGREFHGLGDTAEEAREQACAEVYRTMPDSVMNAVAGEHISRRRGDNAYLIRYLGRLGLLSRPKLSMVAEGDGIQCQCLLGLADDPFVATAPAEEEATDLALGLAVRAVLGYAEIG